MTEHSSTPAVTAGKRVGPLWMTLFTLAWLAIWTVQLTPIQLLLPLQLDTGAPGENWIAGVVWAGVVLSVGGLVGIIAAPVSGRWSDRTRSRWGRRRPWAIGGSLVAAVGLVLTGLVAGPVAVGGAWIVVSVGVSVASAALTAMIADQLTTQRGAASAAASSAQAVGIVVGVGAVVLIGLNVEQSYFLLAAIIAVIGSGTALLLPDAPAHELALPAPRNAARTASWRDRDFLWLLISRFVVNIGNAFGTSLLLFFLLYGVRVPSAAAQDDLLVLIVIYTVFVVIASIIAGILSDRGSASPLRRRRTITAVSAVVQAISGVVILISPSFEMTAVAAAIMGAGYGAYMAVSLAFATDLLKDPDDHARDLGLVNVSAQLGQLLGPLLGAGLVALVGGFWLLFGAAAVLSVVGAAMTYAVRTSSPASPAPTAVPR
ncbi:MFS transporter [Microbacterium azadirachtae]|uniref:Major Facilitator Superfamily protein n=1 Tax=Microbacterium azadirachtae TaxID=582680 RepID=A0A0F0LUT7_9MICO|nr:MFS transporter [Microbacterium azadirachtae]KJL36090.1 Major Facilitator Superfamily protein [Microbacterium azadirachtae]